MKNNNKTIVISGCTRGIGKAIGDLFAVEGFNVAGFARNKKDIEIMSKSFAKKYPGQQFYFAVADASSKKEVLSFARSVSKEFGKIDILINNAGTFEPGNITSEKNGTLEKLIDTNLYSAYYLTSALLDGMIKRKSGHIFNMCSTASLAAYENGGSYSISKFALLGFSKQLRHELKSKNIKVTALMPGATLTDSWSGAGFPDSRFIKAHDIAKTILSVYGLSEYSDVEEIIIRPQLGDI